MRRRPSGLADELEFRQPFDHSARESRTLLGEHDHLGIFESFGELRWIFFGVRVYDDLMAAQFGITSKCSEGVLIIIDDYDLHECFLLLELLSCCLPSFVLSSSCLTPLQFGDIITQSRFEPVLRVKSQLRPCSRDVHPWTRGSQFPTAHLDLRKYFFQRFFDIFDRRQRAATQVVYLV